jgi:hypothetical protein
MLFVICLSPKFFNIYGFLFAAHPESQEADRDSNLMGHFGVGFYYAFLVAYKVYCYHNLSIFVLN